MNYGGGGLIDSSGEVWSMTHVISPSLRNVKSPIVFDVGANNGDYTRLAASHLPSAHILAFEPSTAAYKVLRNELASNQNIETLNFGFSNTERRETLYSYSIEGNYNSLLSSIDLRRDTQVAEITVSLTEEIQLKTIDSFCNERKIDRIHLLKMDVEGHELSVLQGASEMLARDAISIIQFEFGPGNIYSRTFFYDFWTMLSGKYDLFRLIPHGAVPITFYGEHREVFLTNNYLAVSKTNG
jgi:FkbM family methyltransferase